jgi:predicted RNase H-like HicB family nuclease/DNA-binding XRE family transcriptional regulator
MKIKYPVRIEKDEESGVFLVQGIEPLGNVLSYGDTVKEALTYAQDSLTGILGAMLDHGDEIPAPPVLKGKEKDVYWIEPDPKVAIPILVKKTRLEAGMTLEELAAKAGVTYQQVQKWERSGTNPTISSLEKVFRAMGKKLELEVVA